MATGRIFLWWATICLFSTTVAQTPITCEHNNATYQPGTHFTIETCCMGYCNADGSITDTIVCCVFEGAIYQIDEGFAINACKQGMCQSSGKIITEIACCPDLLCPEPIYTADPCCGICPEGWDPPCERNGTYYKQGDVVPLDSCNTATCRDDGLFYPNGRCCEYEDQEYEHDTTFQITKCTTGYCNTGEILFSSPTCCEYGENTYELGTYFKPGKCDDGYCNTDGSVEVSSSGCPMYDNCLRYDDDPDVCCPECIEQPMTPTTPVYMP